MIAFMTALREKVAVGIVGGSDLIKIKEQLGESGANLDVLCHLRSVSTKTNL